MYTRKLNFHSQINSLLEFMIPIPRGTIADGFVTQSVLPRGNNFLPH